MGCVWSARGGWFRWGMYTGPVGVGTIQITRMILLVNCGFMILGAGPACSVGDNARLTVLLTGRASVRAGRRHFRTAPVLLYGVFDPSPFASLWRGPLSSSGVLLLRCFLRWLCLMVLLLDPHYVEV